MKTQATLAEQFLKFCESQPPEKSYEYLDQYGCAVAQFAEALGKSWRDISGSRVAPCAGHQGWDIDYLAGVWPRTFGALVERLKAYIAMPLRVAINQRANDAIGIPNNIYNIPPRFR